MNPDWKTLGEIASNEVDSILKSLPKPLRERALGLAVTTERKPSAELQKEGIEADVLGLFCGPDFAEEEHIPMPPQIILFLENIWDFAERDENVFQDEIRTTFLHELGHYLGLDEDDLVDRDLE